MPSSQNTGRPTRDDQHSSDPFTSFTRFIDERLSYMLQSVIGLPSSKEDMKSWRPWKDLQRKDQHPWERDHNDHREQYQDGNEKDRGEPITYFVTSLHQSPDVAKQTHTTSPASIKREIRSAYVEGQLRPLHTLIRANDEHIMAPSNDTAAPTSTTYDSIERCSADKALSRLENFLNTSLYSPTTLEKDPNLQSVSLNWREAFTDLMNETHGGPLPHLTQNKYLTTTSLEGNTWKSIFLMNFGYSLYINAIRKDLTTANVTTLLDPIALAIFLNSGVSSSTDVMRYQGILSEQMKRSHPERSDNMLDEYEDRYFEAEPHHGRDDVDEDDEEKEERDDEDEEVGFETELDMFQGMINKIFHHPMQDSHNSATSQVITNKSTESERPSIIGRLTNIERFVRADGTTEIRRVLKTRFSNGTENIEESRDIMAGHSPGRPLAERSSEPPSERDSARFVSGNNRSDKSGWFWK